MNKLIKESQMPSHQNRKPTVDYKDEVHLDGMERYVFGVYAKLKHKPLSWLQTPGKRQTWGKTWCLTSLISVSSNTSTQ